MAKQKIDIEKIISDMGKVGYSVGLIEYDTYIVTGNDDKWILNSSDLGKLYRIAVKFSGK